MANSTDKGNTEKNTDGVCDGRSSDEEKSARRAKRLAQHQHWMRVMMEGQSTPDLSYQKSKA